MLNHFLEESLHPCSVNNKRIRRAERFHILGEQLIIMQAACVLCRHVDHGYPADPFC